MADSYSQLLPKLPPALAAGVGCGRVLEAYGLLHRGLQRHPVAQVFEELPLDRPRLPRARVAAQDVIDQGQGAAAGAAREVGAGREQQLFVRALGLVGAHHLRGDADAAMRARFAVTALLLTALQTHARARSEPRPERTDYERLLFAARTLPVDRKRIL